MSNSTNYNSNMTTKKTTIIIISSIFFLISIIMILIFIFSYPAYTKIELERINLQKENFLDELSSDSDDEILLI